MIYTPVPPILIKQKMRLISHMTTFQANIIRQEKKSFTFDNGFLYADSMFVFVGRTKWLLPLMFQMHEGGNNHRQQQESKTPRENLKAYLPPRGSRKTIPLDTLGEP